MPIFAEYDPEARALYIELDEGEVARTVQVDDSLAVDVDAESGPLSIEALEVPVTRAQINGLASRFGFLDKADEAWAAARQAQPAERSRSGMLVYVNLKYPPTSALVVAGASSAQLRAESHEYALGH
jgi:hypothetical protein